MINIVIPMAGEGSRFIKAGYQKPKPFIDVAGKPMIVRVLENLKHRDARYILLARSEHLEREVEMVRDIEKQYNARFLSVDCLTEGTACTVMLAEQYIDNDVPLLIANSDQIVDVDISGLINDSNKRRLDGSIMTFLDKYKDPKWSFARLNSDGIVVEVQEKKAISDYATVGIYWFTRGSDFVRATKNMIAANDRVNGEFYTCPTYNYAISDGKQIGIYNIDFNQMHGLGTPPDLDAYIQRIKV